MLGIFNVVRIKRARGKSLDAIGRLYGMVRHKNKFWFLTIKESDKKFKKRILAAVRGWC